MVVTLLVFQPLKSRDVRELQPENMPFMAMTFSVFKPLKSMDVREVQMLNMLPMSVTPSNFDAGTLQLPLASGVTVYLVPNTPPLCS